MSSLDHATAAGDAPAGAVAPNAWIRNAGRTRAFAALAYVNTAAWVVIAAYVATDSQYTGDMVNLTVMLVFLLGVAALSMMAGRRIAHCGLWLSREAVIVNGPLRSWKLPVSEVEGFEPGARGAHNGTPCPVLKRARGRAIGVWALGRDGLISSDRSSLAELEPLCEELSRLLDTLRAASAAPVI